MFNSKSSDSLEHQPPPRSDPPSMVVQPPPTQVQFTTIGKQPKLLERMSAPDSNEGPPTRYPSPTPSPDLSHESMSVDVESASTRALPLSRPTLLQVLTNPDTTMSEPDALPTVQDNNISRESAEANVLSFSAVPPRLERQAVASQRVSRSTSPTSPLLVSITPQLTRNSFLNSILNSEPSTSSQNNPNSYIPLSSALAYPALPPYSSSTPSLLLSLLNNAQDATNSWLQPQTIDFPPPLPAIVVIKSRLMSSISALSNASANDSPILVDHFSSLKAAQSAAQLSSEQAESSYRAAEAAYNAAQKSISAAQESLSLAQGSLNMAQQARTQSYQTRKALDAVEEMMRTRDEKVDVILRDSREAVEVMGKAILERETASEKHKEAEVKWRKVEEETRARAIELARWYEMMKEHEYKQQMRLAQDARRTDLREEDSLAQIRRHLAENMNLDGKRIPEIEAAAVRTEWESVKRSEEPRAANEDMNIADQANTSHSDIQTSEPLKSAPLFLPDPSETSGDVEIPLISQSTTTRHSSKLRSPPVSAISDASGPLELDVGPVVHASTTEQILNLRHVMVAKGVDPQLTKIKREDQEMVSLGLSPPSCEPLAATAPNSIQPYPPSTSIQSTPITSAIIPPNPSFSSFATKSSAAPTPSPKKPVIPPPRPKQLATTLQKSQAPPSVNQANPAPNVASPQGTQGRTLVPARVDAPQTNPSLKVTGKQLYINRYQEPVSRISTFSTSARAPSASIFSASPDSPLAKTHPAGELFNRMQTSPQKITQRNPYWENSTEEYERRSLFDNITSHSATLRYDHYSPPPDRYTEADYEASVRPPLPPTRMTVHRGDHYSPPPLGYPRRSPSPPLVGRKRPRKQWTPPALNIEQDRQWKRSRVMGSPVSPVQWQEQQDDNPAPYNERMSPPTDLLSRMSDSNAVQLTDADASPYSNIRRPYARHNPSARRGSGARGRGTSGGVPLSSRMAGGSLQDRLG